MNIYQKLIEVRKIVPYLQKENTGAQYKYVSSSQVLATLKAKMDELGLLLIPAVTGHNLHVSTVETQNDAGVVIKKTSTYFTELDMTMTWVNAEKPDETIVCPWYGQGVDIAGEKGVGKAMTYAEKYFMLKTFNIATDKDDPDAFQNKHSDDKPQKNSQPAAKPAQPQQPTKLAEAPKAQQQAEPPKTEPSTPIDGPQLPTNIIRQLHAIRGKFGIDETEFKSRLSKFPLVGFEVVSLHDLAKMPKDKLSHVIAVLAEASIKQGKTETAAGAEGVAPEVTAEPMFEGDTGQIGA